MEALSQTTFDYVIVGAGSAGATLASRLSEDVSKQICLIEAGSRDRNPLIHIPFGLSLLSRIDNVNWSFDTTAQSHLNLRRLYWPRGKTLGGSSSINAMCYIRGDAKDYDKWDSQGAIGWNWHNVLPYFKKSECFVEGEDEFHGVDGPLGVSPLRHVSPLSHSFVNAASDVDVKQNYDFNRREREGLGLYHVTQKNGQRCSSAKGFLSDIRSRKNLTVITDTAVEKVLMEKTRAFGVRVTRNNQSFTIYANREVILSGGTINSPQLLMLSGIGDKTQLDQHNIPTIVNRLGVGKNLQDHLDVMVQHKNRVKEGYGVALSALPMYAKSLFQYMFARKGLFSSNIAEAGGFLSSSIADSKPDIQLHFLPAILKDHGRDIVPGYGFGLHACCLYPKSRGEIRLGSRNPRVTPIIDPNYLAHEDDKIVMLEAFKQARKILNSNAFAKYRSHEFIPGAEVETDEDILEYIREHSETIYHPVGTCKMGHASDVMAVVDNELKVIGTDNLRVVDASVMPTIVGGNTNAPTIMIAERAADFIKGDAY